MMSRLWQCVLVGGSSTGMVIPVRTPEEDFEPPDIELHGQTFRAKEVNLMTLRAGSVVDDADERRATGAALMYRDKYTPDEEARALGILEAL